MVNLDIAINATAVIVSAMTFKDAITKGRSVWWLYFYITLMVFAIYQLAVIFRRQNMEFYRIANMTTGELINAINSLTHKTTIRTGGDGNTGDIVNGREGYFASEDNDGNVVCQYSPNGYAYQRIFKMNFASEEMNLEIKTIVSNRKNDLQLRSDTAKLLKVIARYMESGEWLPTEEFRQKKIEELEQKIQQNESGSKELQDRINALKGGRTNE